MKMRNTLVAAMILGIALGSCGKETSTESGRVELDGSVKEKTLEILKKSAGTVMPALMKKVQEKMKEEGPEATVVFCNENVAGLGKTMREKLQASFQESDGVQSFRFGRTSLKLRNPGNAPTDEQKKVLEKWEAGEKNGEVASPVVYGKGDMVYGMMPIRIVSPACLKCHGTEETRDAGASRAIQERYPEDRAVGYRENDLRGAFWIEAKL